jgi:hypothetical protein
MPSKCWIDRGPDAVGVEASAGIYSRPAVVLHILLHVVYHFFQEFTALSNIRAMAKVGGLAEEDPRLSFNGLSPTFEGLVRPQHRQLYDSSVSIEEYLYYAERTRADQDMAAEADAGVKVPLYKVLFPPKSTKTTLDQKMAHLNTSVASQRAVVTDEEWINASKALRNATAMAVFYLLTTDVLGPFGLPYAIATTGWGYLSIINSFVYLLTTT